MAPTASKDDLLAKGMPYGLTTLWFGKYADTGSFRCPTQKSKTLVGFAYWPNVIGSNSGTNWRDLPIRPETGIVMWWLRYGRNPAIKEPIPFTQWSILADEYHEDWGKFAHDHAGMNLGWGDSHVTWFDKFDQPNPFVGVFSYYQGMQISSMDYDYDTAKFFGKITADYRLKR